MKTDPSPAVRATELRYAYGERVALDGVSFEVGRGEIFGFLGPNGSGKSTLFRLLATLAVAEAGSLRLLGLAVPEDRHRVRRRMGVVFQSPSVDSLLSVEENLRHHGHLYRLRGTSLDHAVDRELERFELTGRRGDRVAELSGGLRRRVELAKVLLPEPELLLLDEPSTGLDPGARRELWAALEQLRREAGVTVLLTTHFMEEGERCDRLALLDRGRIVATGEPAALTAKIGGEVVLVRTAEPEALRRAAGERLGIEGSIVDGLVRFELADGHRLVTRLAETFPGALEEVRLSRPSLEDVFLHRTGHRLTERQEGRTR